MRPAKLMSIHLFPHSRCPGSIIEKIISFFGTVNVYLPWMMETPEVLKNISIDISRPPVYMKPGDYFMAMLAEYRRWVERNNDRNYIELLKFGPPDKLTDNKTWEIRQMLGHRVESHSGREEDAIRWHLLLHLAGDIEEKRLETDILLKALKDKKAPLDGSIEDNSDIKELLRDLYDLGTEPVLNDWNLIQILEAWFGLFGGYLDENNLLITYDRQVMGYLTERWDALCLENVSTVNPVIGFNVPDLSSYTPEVQENIQMKNDIERILREIKDLIITIGKDPTHSLIALDRLSHELDKAVQRISSKSAFRFTIRYLYPIKGKVLTESDMVFGHLFNQIIILAEE